MESSRVFRVAVIGIGAIADFIAMALAEIPSAKLVAGSCRTKAKGRKFAERFGCKWFDDSEKMLDEVRPDAAIVCTPSGQHLESVLACTARKIHVVCEKPLDITTARVRQMIEAANRAGVKLGAIFPQRFNPVNRLLHDSAAAGRFGQLAVIHATVPWWRDDEYYSPARWQGKLALDGGGALMNQAIHTVDQIIWIAGATMPELARDANPVEEVFALTAKRSHDPKVLEVEDTSVIAIKFRNGALGQLLAATSMWPGSPRRIYIAGRDGTAEVLEDQLVQFKFRSEAPGDAATRERLGKPTLHGGGAGNPLAMTHENHQRNLLSFFQALEENREPPLNGVEAAKAVAVIDACYESARTHRPVAVHSGK